VEAPLNTAFLIDPPALTLARMPFQMVAQTAGTPNMMEGRKVLMSLAVANRSVGKGLRASIADWQAIVEEDELNNKEIGKEDVVR
jgi:hypothetical protein